VCVAKTKNKTFRMIRFSTIRKTAALQIFALLLVVALPILLANRAAAAGFLQTWVRLDRMKASTFTSGLVCAQTPATDTGTEIDVQVVFPSDFVVGTTLTDWAVATTDLPSGATIWPGIGQATAANNTTKTVTFPSSALTTSTLYCFRWTNSTAALQTGSSGANKTGTVTTRATGPTSLDSSAYSTAIVSNDQVVITATVPATFSFSLPTNSIAFLSNLTTTPVLTSTSVATISTNASSGWVAWVKSANAALNSVSTGASIPTAGSIDNAVTDVATTNGYFLDVAFTDSGNGTGNVTQAANYGQEYNGDATHGGTLSTTFQPVAASSGTTDGDTLIFTALARISAIQAAATDYTDTLTIVAAGRF
jgi:hypothetical protein